MRRLYWLRRSSTPAGSGRPINAADGVAAAFGAAAGHGAIVAQNALALHWYCACAALVPCWYYVGTTAGLQW